jgi:nicotinamide-nucleotide amidase
MADHDALYQLAQALVNDLREAGKVVVTAESCTGGWIAKAVTDVPGSSACFGYGIVSYSNGAKESILGVQSPTLEENGSVSEPAVREMVDGALHLSGADIGVAVSGIAGPDGGTDEKPLGTVWFAWGSRDGAKIHIDSACRHFEGDREAIRELTVAYALQGVLDRLQE